MKFFARLIKQLIRFFRSYFDISLKEARGIIVMMLVCIFIMLYASFYKFYMQMPDTLSVKDTKLLDSLQDVISKKIIKNNTVHSQPKHNYENNNEKSTAVLFTFNPNQSSVKDYMKMGLREKTAKSIVNYVNKGGVFKTKNDFKKIYGIDSGMFARLKPYIDLPDTPAKKVYPKFEKQIIPPKQKLKIELNSADSLALEKIYGVGSKLASRIVKYRKKLGGFYEVRQLYEIWGIDTAIVNEIEKVSTIDTKEIVKININTASIEELKAHPYLKSHAKFIVSYRQMHGYFKEINELKQLKPPTPLDIDKISPYIEF